MSAKDNDINMTMKFWFKMRSCEKEKLLYSFVKLLTWINCDRIHKFLSFSTWHYFQKSIWLQMLKYIIKQVALESFLKKPPKNKKPKKTLKDVPRTIATAKMELSVALVISFQPLNNFTKNPNISARGVLRSPNASLEYYNHRNYISML